MREGLLFTVSLVATLISSMSGGGSSVITTPTWLLLGYPLPVVIASNLLGGGIWTLVAARNYLRNTTIEWKVVLIMAVSGLLGCRLGVSIVSTVDVHAFSFLFGWIILVLVLIMYARPHFGTVASCPRIPIPLTALGALPLGLYESTFGSGNGILSSFFLCKARGYTLPKALGTYYLISCVWCWASSLTLISNGHADFMLFAITIVGSATGAAIGSHIGATKGAHFMKYVFMICGLCFSLKLLSGY